MKVAIIGTGYVGLPTGVGLAELGHTVICIDRESSKIEKLRQGKITLYEEGLEELFHKNLAKGTISFTMSMEEGIRGADLVMIAVGTPPHPVTKEADMQYVYAAATELADFLDGYTVVATKSTVPVGTGDVIESLINKKNRNAQFDVVSLPEFLREGYAVHDFFNPDRIIAGANTTKAKELIDLLYSPMPSKPKILFVQRRSAETIKYASNAFLAIKIHYINEMADFCEKVGANIEEVADGMGLDSRIGNKFLVPGPGYGGSCFPKDTKAMAFMAKVNEVEMSLIETAIAGNEFRQKNLAHHIIKEISHIETPIVAVLGLTFKSGTDDCRESPAITMVEELLERDIRIQAFDPKGIKGAKELLGNRIEYAGSIENALYNAHAVLIATEWEEFKNISIKTIEANMQGKWIFDYRNLLDKDSLINAGFKYVGLGR